MKDRVLVVAAHPDDEVLGCGGVIARLTKEGREVYALILGEGITARDENRNIKKRGKELEILKRCARSANKVLGVKHIFLYDFPNIRFDEVALLDIVKVVEKIKNEIKPAVIFTNHKGDLNLDHRITCEAVLSATRPLAGETVKEIYSFETLSSTEWRYPLSFLPDLFFDITGTIKLKLKAMNEYYTELREYPHPRSIEGVTINAKNWGMKSGVHYAEAFKTLRVIK